MLNFFDYLHLGFDFLLKFSRSAWHFLFVLYLFGSYFPYLYLWVVLLNFEFFHLFHFIFCILLDIYFLLAQYFVNCMNFYIQIYNCLFWLFTSFFRDHVLTVNYSLPFFSYFFCWYNFLMFNFRIELGFPIKEISSVSIIIIKNKKVLVQYVII